MIATMLLSYIQLEPFNFKAVKCTLTSSVAEIAVFQYYINETSEYLMLDQISIFELILLCDFYVHLSFC